MTVPAADFIVIGIAEPSEGTFWRPALVLATASGHEIRYVGRVAVGSAELVALEAVLPQLRRTSAPCRAAGPAEVWLAPRIVCEVLNLASSQRGLRHAVFIRFRPRRGETALDEPDRLRASLVSSAPCGAGDGNATG